jgi:hypothetical protein
MNTETLTITFMDFQEFLDICRKPFASCGLNVDTMILLYPIDSNFCRVATRHDFSSLKPAEDYKNLIHRLEIQNNEELCHYQISEILAEFAIKGLVPMSDFILY